MTLIATTRLGDLIEERTERLGDSKATIYSVTNDRGFVRSLDLFDKQVFSADTSNYKRVAFEDLAYNPSRINVGSVALCNDQGGGAVSPMYVIVRCKPGLLPRYLLHFLKSEEGLRHIRHRCEGAVRSQLRFRDLCEIPLFIPTLAEQERLVSLLEDADTLRTLRAQTNRRTADAIPALFNEMFGDPSAGSLRCPRVSIGDITSVQTGRTPSRAVAANFGGTIPWIKSTEVDGKPINDTGEKLTDQGLRSVNGQLFPINSIIVAMYGQGKTRGQSSVLTINAFCNQACAVILPSDVFSTSFLFEYLQLSYDRLRALARGGNQPNLNLDIVRSFTMPLPPLALQEEFAEHAAVVRRVEADQATSSACLDALFRSITHRAVGSDSH